MRKHGGSCPNRQRASPLCVSAEGRAPLAWEGQPLAWRLACMTSSATPLPHVSAAERCMQLADELGAAGFVTVAPLACSMPRLDTMHVKSSTTSFADDGFGK